MDTDLKKTIVLGAGASRSVSYANAGGHPSPLDYDFFDLLRRLAPASNDKESVAQVLGNLPDLPADCRRSMEKSFYTLHQRAFLTRKLSNGDRAAEQTVVKNYARCIQALLRAAHGKKRCRHHVRISKDLTRRDTIISFNYDLVMERALCELVGGRPWALGPHTYGLQDLPSDYELPLLLKLHGSSNWELLGQPGKARIGVRTRSWGDFDRAPGYKGHKGQGTEFPIFLPFWDKRVEDGPWLKIWKRAFERLETTECLIVWGYSLPPSDIKSHQLFYLTLGKKPINLCVIDPSDATRNRWREALPKAKYWEYGTISDFFKEPPAW